MNVHYIESIFAQTTLFSLITKPDIGEAGEIVIVTRELLNGPAALSEHTLYLCHGNKIAALLRHRPAGQCITVITAGYAKVLETLTPESGINVIATSLELGNLYNQLNRTVLAYGRGILKVRQAVYAGESLQRIMDIIADAFAAPVFLLDSGYRLVAKSVSQTPAGDEPREFVRGILQELHDNSRLSFETVMLRDQNASALLEANHVLARRIRIQTATAARLYVVLPPDTAATGFHNEWMDEMAACLSEYFHHEKLIPNANSRMDTFIAGILQHTFPDEETIRKSAALLHVTPAPCYGCIAVRPETASMQPQPVSYMVAQLSELFPGAWIAVYQDTILVLTQHREWTHGMERLEFQEGEGCGAEAFTAFLDNMDAYAGISYCSHFYAALPEMYEESLAAIRFGRRIPSRTPGHTGGDPARIFYYDDYHPYLLLDLCHEALQGKSAQSSMWHLCSPAFLTLLRHDRENHDNLTEILYVYLCCDGSPTRAAHRLYMHRNTLVGRIEKIRDIIGSDLEDPGLRLSLRLSYMIAQYTERILHEPEEDLPKRYRG